MGGTVILLLASHGPKVMASPRFGTETPIKVDGGVWVGGSRSMTVHWPTAQPTRSWHTPPAHRPTRHAQTASTPKPAGSSGWCSSLAPFGLTHPIFASYIPNMLSEGFKSLPDLPAAAYAEYLKPLMGWRYYHTNTQESY